MAKQKIEVDIRNVDGRLQMSEKLHEIAEDILVRNETHTRRKGVSTTDYDWLWTISAHT